MLPTLLGGMHWCVVLIDIWETILYYDPMKPGLKSEKAISYIVFFLDQLNMYRLCDLKYMSRTFVNEFIICWENKFPPQNDYSSCGIYILMYIRKIANEKLQKNIAFELLQNSLNLNQVELKHVHTTRAIPSLYRQCAGKDIILRCKTTGTSARTFSWIFKNEMVCNI